MMRLPGISGFIKKLSLLAEATGEDWAGYNFASRPL
jgi:hypothetical protein